MNKRFCLARMLVFELYFFLILSFFFLPGKTRGELVAERALAEMGKPYVLGQAGPISFDCSGLVLRAFEDYYEEPIPHSAQLIWETIGYRTISNPNELLTGDVICFDTIVDRDPSDHVGIWLGNNRFVHASSGAKQVTISELEGYYVDHYSGAKRLLCPYF